ncbi:hypothetical protein H5410_051422 [Solanum commersonii]|uniref:Uncharacterized protein n=1 Tax=Solanum commersonii TaxID=4109 RepID=A0A9J5WYC9_SOLCO|nr:hypothetical protein H5410_051422 [Solanum commersonii]
MEFKQDPYYPLPWDTQISPEFAAFGHLTIFSLKNGITHSIIEQIFDILAQTKIRTLILPKRPGTHHYDTITAKEFKIFNNKLRVREPTFDAD